MKVVMRLAGTGFMMTVLVVTGVTPISLDLSCLRIMAGAQKAPSAMVRNGNPLARFRPCLVRIFGQ